MKIDNERMMPELIIRTMGPVDLETVWDIARRAYSLNFAHHWEEGGLGVYMEKVFGKEVIAAQLADPAVRFFVAFVEGEPVGFLKLNLVAGLTAEVEDGKLGQDPAEEEDGKQGLDAREAMELDKLYILPGNKGLGIGQRLMEKAFELAREMGKAVIWLAVLDKNEPAIAFYEKAGFVKTGKMRVEYPRFKEELRGMWRMELRLSVSEG